MTSVTIERRDELPLILIAYASFVVMGMPMAVLGVLTAAIQTDFGLSLAAIGQIFLAFSAGYVVASAATGRLTARFRTGLLLALSCTISMIALGLFIFLQSWPLIVLCGGIFGMSVAVQDAGLNIVFAARFNTRLMNWLHACFGLGAMLAPLIGTFVLTQGMEWRTVYILLASLYAVISILFWSTLERWTVAQRGAQTHAHGDTSLARTVRIPFVWVGIGLFFSMAGLEAATGQWAPSLLTEGRGIDQTTAGYWTTAYWASFTIGRIFFGAVNLKLSAYALVRAVALACIAGVLLLWWSPVDALDLVALLIIGFSLAPMFATLVTNTQAELGERQAPNAIGIQMAAASLGAGVLPWATGVVAQGMGLEAITPFLFIFILLLNALLIFMMRAPRTA